MQNTTFLQRRKRRKVNDGHKDFQKVERDGPEFLCSGSQYIWFGDGSSDRTAAVQATSMQ